MKAQLIKSWLCIGAACVMMAPATGMAEEKYLKGQTSYKPLEKSTPDPYPEGFPQDYWLGGGKLTPEIREKRIRAEARIDDYQERLVSGDLPHDDSHHFSEKDFKELVAKAQAGDREAIGMVAEAYAQGLGTKKNEKQALEWYKSAVQHGQTQYYSAIGNMYREYQRHGEEKPGFLAGLRKAMTGGEDTSVTQNDQLAREWFEKGVAEKDWGSYLGLGIMYRDGAGGLPKDKKQASFYYDEGLRLKRLHNEKARKNMIYEYRKQVETEEGLRAR